MMYQCGRCLLQWIASKARSRVGPRRLNQLSVSTTYIVDMYLCKGTDGRIMNGRLTEEAVEDLSRSYFRFRL